MTQQLDLADIQGNIVQAYVRRDFPKARFVFLRVGDGDAGRAFVGAITRKITTSVPWGQVTPKPRVTTNVAFTFEGLKALGLPTASLSGFPEEFVMGMKRRRAILGDDGPSAPENWDPVWQNDVHLCLSINGQTPADVEERYRWIEDVVAQSGGVVLLAGHRGDGDRDDLPYQDASTLYDQEDKPTAKEHFGYTDGIGDPVFEGQPRVLEKVVGRGKPTRERGWKPLATGEFLLGHPDEAKEYPAAPMPITLPRNGTYMVYRKLHENVASFDGLLERHAATFPGGKELLAAKFAGRWRDNGAPLVSAPNEDSKAAWDRRYRDAAADPREQNRMLADFTYDDDLDGGKCPISAHIRRINTRGSLEFGQTGAFDTPGALDNRRRMLRRGIPYGEAKDRSRDDGNHGIVFIAINASIKRQFEFVQQQWINYGNDFKQANDKEILVGNHGSGHPGKAVIQADPQSARPPYFVNEIPRLVETRGGDYFFIPSMTALRMIAKGIVDPT